MRAIENKFSIKSFLNFKENKSYKITIIILFVICLVFQASTAFSNKKVRAASLEIASLKEKIKMLEDSTTVVSNIDELVDTKKIDKDIDKNIDIDKANKIKREATFKRYIEVGKENGKEYDETIKAGKRILAIETLDLNYITEGQIKAGISNLSKDKFGIEIAEKKFEGKIFYKIILIE